jgi:mannose-6-phosphate isomerase-like protein (cupin superfamily)
MFRIFCSLCFLFVLIGCKDKESSSSSNYVIQIKQLKRIDAGNGEVVFQMEGKDYNLDQLSFVFTETQPHGGPPLHVHESEEVHIIMEGKVQYRIGDTSFTATGPLVTRVPANTPHTFMNAGDSVLNLIAVFPRNNFGKYQPIGKNPFMEHE